MQVAMGFWPSKTVLSELFTQLGAESMTGEEIDGDGGDRSYRNTPETAAFLDKRQGLAA
jgi:hypothetical protein